MKRLKQKKLHMLLMTVLGLILFSACGGGSSKENEDVNKSIDSINNITDNSTERSWNIAQMLESDMSGTSFKPDISVGSSDHAMVVWYQNKNIWVKQFKRGQGWSEAKMLSEKDLAPISNAPKVACNNQGNCIVVWTQKSPTNSANDDLWANYFDIDEGWKNPQKIGDKEDAYSPSLAMDNNGNAIAIWEQSDPLEREIWINSFTPHSGWKGVTQISSGEGGKYDPQIVMNDSEHAIALWRQKNHNGNIIVTKHFDPTIGWSTNRHISTDGVAAANPHISLNGLGYAGVVWQQGGSVWTSHFGADKVWSNPTNIVSENSGYSEEPKIILDDLGNAMVVWTQYVDNISTSIWSNRFDEDAGWSGVMKIQDASIDAKSPQVAVDGQGNIMAVWIQKEDIRNSVWSNYFNISSGWGSAEKIQTVSGNASSPQIDLDRVGHGVAVWTQDTNRSTKVWVNEFK